MSNVKFADDVEFAGDDFDWTNGDQAGAAPPADPMDFVIPAFSSAVDVEAAEQEAADSQFAAPPPGDYLFEVRGLLKAPEKVTKNGYVAGQSVSYSVWRTTVKLSVVGKPNWTMLEYMELPDAGPRDLAAFRAASAKADGKVGGFMCRKLEQFLKRIGFAVVAGQAIPPEALAIRNWVGRKVYATVQMGRPQIDVTTGKPRVDVRTGFPYPARAEIKSMSYREAEETAARAAGQGGQGVPAAPPAGRPAGTFKPQSASDAEFLKAGLANI